MEDPKATTGRPADTELNKQTFSLKHFFTELDWAFGRFVVFVLESLSYLLLLGLGAFSIKFVIESIEEYQEGLSDLSNIEIAFLFFAFILFRRYLIYCEATSFGWLRQLTTPIVWYGKFSLVCILIGLSFAFLDLKNETDRLAYFIQSNKNYLQLLAFVLALVCLYISVPSKSLRTEVQGASTSEPSEAKKEDIHSSTSSQNSSGV
ncbi:hypothetical protein [Vibrio algarum]|uniref:Uncharacterized protein n=1 Tax=Vibrio algarum TaxID=3020714 RepID=A0ABT4YT29_9VIBR|nr:hypothetical protein [Vibrio sp. KJ40-1]MDB1124683.1 hypothetical protein [Vibrio sp. KJ40-1]